MACSSSRDTSSESSGLSTRRADYSKYFTRQVYWVDKAPRFKAVEGRPYLNSSKAVVDYLDRQNQPPRPNHLVILMLNDDQDIVGREDLQCPTGKAVDDQKRQILHLAKAEKPAYVILVHCRSYAKLSPYSDLMTTAKELDEELSASGIDLLDLLVLNEDRCFSFADHHLL